MHAVCQWMKFYFILWEALCFYFPSNHWSMSFHKVGMSIFKIQKAFTQYFWLFSKHRYISVGQAKYLQVVFVMPNLSFNELQATLISMYFDFKRCFVLAVFEIHVNIMSTRANVGLQHFSTLKWNIKKGQHEVHPS